MDGESLEKELLSYLNAPIPPHMNFQEWQAREAARQAAAVPSAATARPGAPQSPLAEAAAA